MPAASDQSRAGRQGPVIGRGRKTADAPQAVGNSPFGRARNACGAGDCCWIRQRALGTRSLESGRRWCAASEQPPHVSAKNSFSGPPPFPCGTTVDRPPKPPQRVSPNPSPRVPGRSRPDRSGSRTPTCVPKACTDAPARCRPLPNPQARRHDEAMSLLTRRRPSSRRRAGAGGPVTWSATRWAGGSPWSSLAAAGRAASPPSPPAAATPPTPPGTCCWVSASPGRPRCGAVCARSTCCRPPSRCRPWR